jgi:hypothetical protein
MTHSLRQAKLELPCIFGMLYKLRVLEGCIEFDFIAHPEVSYVVVEHLIQNCVPMTMY